MIFKNMLKELFNPRFSTGEIENSRMHCNLDFEFHSFFYDDFKRGFPTLVIGCIKTRRGHRLPSTWNRYGKCTLNSKRIKAFDLIRPNQKEINTGKAVCESLIVGMIVIWISIIF